MQVALWTGEPAVVTLRVCNEKIRQMTNLENKETHMTIGSITVHSCIVVLAALFLEVDIRR